MLFSTVQSRIFGHEPKPSMRLFLASALLACLFAPYATQAQRPEAIPGDLLVMLRPGASAGAIAADLALTNGQANGLRVVHEVSAPMRTWLLQFDPTRAEQAVMLRAVRQHPAVQMAQNNHRLKLRAVPNDVDYGEQWHHQNINSEAAWDISTGGVTADGDTIVVCIIENADLPHSDLIGNAWFNHAEIPNNDVDDDNNGYVDDFRGWNPNSQTDQVYSGSHGTEVAGMIGATGNNNEGVSGANWAVKMMVVFNSGASDEGVIASHSYPLVMRRLYNESNGAQGAFVVATNASWGIDGGQPEDAPLWCALYDTLGTAGILNCGATANNNVDIDVVNDLPTGCPSDFMISVTATNVDDERTFSGYGLTTIDVGAPGSDVYTTQLGGGYGTTSGTSFATPLTAGVIGLLYSAPCASMMDLVKGDPAAGALFIRQMLFEGVDQVGNLPGNTVTGGRINAGTSMEMIMASCGTCPSPYNLNVQVVTVNSALLAWTTVSGSSYDLRYRTVGTLDWTEVNGITEAEYELQALQTCTPYEFQVRVACDGELSEFSNLYTWTSEGCCSAPVGLSQGFVGTNLVNALWNDVLAANSFDVRYAPSGSSTFTIVVGVTDPFVAIEPLVPCANYTVQVRANCEGLTSDWSSPLTVGTSGCGPCVDNAYCGTAGGDTEDEWIAVVQIGDINNSTDANGGYGDFTSLSTDLSVGSDHVIRLEPGYSGFNYSEWFSVWIDLDQDGQLTSPSELVFDTGGSSNDPVLGSITIPWDATLGPTRMRVMMKYNEAPTSACEASFDHGEVEDYCVDLVANTTAGLNDAVANDGTLLFPVPADQQLFMQLPARLALLNVTLEVFDGTGRKALQRSLLGAMNEVPTTGLADGLYTYRLSVQGTKLGQGRFVVAHTR
jgi:hypothetical protein